MNGLLRNDGYEGLARRVLEKFWYVMRYDDSTICSGCGRPCNRYLIPHDATCSMLHWAQLIGKERELLPGSRDTLTKEQFDEYVAANKYYCHEADGWWEKHAEGGVL